MRLDKRLAAWIVTRRELVAQLASTERVASGLLTQLAVKDRECADAYERGYHTAKVSDASVIERLELESETLRRRLAEVDR